MAILLPLLGQSTGMVAVHLKILLRNVHYVEARRRAETTSSFDQQEVVQLVLEASIAVKIGDMMLLRIEF